MLVDEIIETEDFIIIGRDDINSNPKRKALTEIVQKICSDKPKILMDYNPVGIADGDSKQHRSSSMRTYT